MDTENLKEKIKRIKAAPKLWIYIAVAAVCFLTLLVMREPEGENKPQPEPEEVSEEPSEDYCETLERALEDILSGISGAGDVRVMITVEGSAENIYAEDASESEQKTERDTVIIGSKEALLKQVKNPEVKGVLVICDGGGRAQVKEQVVNAVSTVLDIPASKVYVTKSK